MLSTELLCHFDPLSGKPRGDIDRSPRMLTGLNGSEVSGTR